jgi:ubiquinone/menaquinone biosynthesis C-methylase UbiE
VAVITRTESDRIRAFYDREAKRYDSAFTERLALRARTRIGRMVEGRVLEVGVGTGLNLVHYPAGAEVTGIDLSPGMLALARSRAAGLDLKADLREMDAQALDFPDRSFDSVVFSLCLCTIPDPERAIREGLRVARPGARMIFFEHVLSNWPPVALLQQLINPLTVLVMADHFNRRTLETVRGAGIKLDYLRRAWLGVFVLAAGRAPQMGLAAEPPVA